MASAKKTFAPLTFGANTFASGHFRGIGSAVPVSQFARGTLLVYPRASGFFEFLPPRARGVLSVQPRATGILQVDKG